MSERAVIVLLSGGLDSSVLVHQVVRETPASLPVHTLAFDYGQRHRRELDAARIQSAAAGAASHRQVDLSAIGALVAGGTSLVTGGARVPDLSEISEADTDQPPTYVPNRNMMLLSVAAACAEAEGARDVFYGAQAQDEYGYWDCTRDFLVHVNALLLLNRRNVVRIQAPFVEKRKSELVTLGIGLGVDFAQTWSCYRGGELACGTCPTCVERLRAFEEAGAEDPLAYQEPEGNA